MWKLFVIGQTSKIPALITTANSAHCKNRLFNVIRETNSRSIYTQLRIELNWFYSSRQLENLCYPLNQSDAKVKPLATRSLSFSGALYHLFVSTLSSDWLLEMFYFVLIGWYYFGADFTTLTVIFSFSFPKNLIFKDSYEEELQFSPMKTICKCLEE